MDYAILRLSKLKSLSALSGISRHDEEREALRYRAHPERSSENYHLRPSGSYASDQTLQDRWQALVGEQKIRKNAVYAYEVVLSFSPSAVARIPIDDWVLDNARWLADTFGGKENILDISVHLDETTPHIHAVVVPIDEKRKLNAKYYTGSRQQLSDLQTSYAAAMETYGLSRGIRYYERPDRVYHQSHHKYHARQQLRDHSVPDRTLDHTAQQIIDDILYTPSRERELTL